ncbi:chloride conductance regulatory protein [Acrasis kona]|uniref:Chloride conductance regulatory protein n=1 Tax=Acrasis kona TaxID=1008807 RepID=A0AAW2YWN8_9EUKA
MTVVLFQSDSNDINNLLKDEEKILYEFKDLKLTFSKQTDDDEDDSDDDESITKTNDDQSIQKHKSEELGILHLTNKTMYWISNESKQGYEISFPHIVMHAVENKTTLYCQLDTDESEEVSEMRVQTVENNEDTLVQQLFKCFSEIAILNPEESEDDDGSMDELIMNFEEIRKNMLLHERDENGSDEDVKRSKIYTPEQ